LLGGITTKDGIAVPRGIARGGRITAAPSAAGSSVQAGARNDWNGRVHVVHKRVDTSVFVFVDWGIWKVDVHRESADQVTWNIRQSQGCDEFHLAGGVQWDKTVHDDLISPQTQSIRNSSRQIFENLSG